VQFHWQKDALATLALTHVADPTQYGMVLTDNVGRVRQFLEKPSHQQAISNVVNAGIYVLEPGLLDNMRPDSSCDFSYDIFPRLLKQNQALFGYLAEGYWRDMGTIQSYQQCLADVRAGKVKLMRDTTHGWIAIDEIAKQENAPIIEPLVKTSTALEPLR
jgi:mannose-1-phosphate guanylyltransferase/phosphomannomutase